MWDTTIVISIAQLAICNFVTAVNALHNSGYNYRYLLTRLTYAQALTFQVLWSLNVRYFSD